MTALDEDHVPSGIRQRDRSDQSVGPGTDDARVGVDGRNHSAQGHGMLIESFRARARPTIGVLLMSAVLLWRDENVASGY